MINQVNGLPFGDEGAPFPAGNSKIAPGEPITCPRCGAQNIPGTIVCLGCGGDLAAAPRPRPPSAVPPLTARPRRPGSAPTRPRQSDWSCLGLGGLLVAAVLVILFFAAPSTTVTLTPDRQVLSETFPVQASPLVKAMDVDRLQIPARVATYEASGSGQIAVTKQKEVITGRAQGLVIFANRADLPVVVPQGTVVANANGTMRYETTEEVTVPGAVFATAKVGVRSLVDGPGGNTEKLVVSRIEGSLSALLYVANDLPLAGGDKRLVTYVTNDDRTRLREQVLAKLKEEAQGRLQVRVTAGEYVAAETVRPATVWDEIYDRAVNEEATTLGLRMRVTFSATLVDGQRANDLALQALLKKVKPGYQLQMSTVQITPREVQRVDGEAVTFLMQAQGTAVAVVDEAKIRSDLAGKTVAEAQTYLDSLPNQAQRARVEIFPGWLGRVARLDFRVTINTAPRSLP
jgi:hypothetical protein